MASSLVITPLAAAVPSAAPEAPDRATVKPSLASTAVSPATLMVMVFEVSPAAKVIVPAGRAPPEKSAELAGFAPEPVTDQFTVETPVAAPVRVTM